MPDDPLPLALPWAFPGVQRPWECFDGIANAPARPFARYSFDGAHPPFPFGLPTSGFAEMAGRLLGSGSGHTRGQIGENIFGGTLDSSIVG